MALTKVSSGLISADASLVDLNIDAGTLYIDATNNRVGVKNQTPTVALDVTGDLVVSASATLGTTSVGQLTFTSLTNTTTDISEGSKLFFTEQRVLDTAPSGSLGGTLGDVTVQYRTDGNYSGTPNQGSFYFDALNSRLKVYTGSEFIDTIPFTAGGGGGATTEANATFFKYQYTVTSETNNITGADIQEIPSGAYVIGKSYEISVPGTTDFTALGSADNISGTTFTATATGLVTAGDFVATEEYTIVSVDDGAGGATTDFTLIGAADNDIGTTFTATGVGAGTGFASQGSGTAHGVLGYSTSSSTDVVVFVNGVKQRESSIDGYQASTGTNIAFTYNLPVDSVVDVQVYELLKNDAYYTKAQTYTQTETNTQISTALSTYDDQTASDTRYVNVTGDTMTGSLSFGDNGKAIFGAGSDLQIYHDGSNSWVSDQGTGQLILESGGAGVYIQKGATETMANFVADGAVSLYHDNSKKFETTATGIDVTGSVTADGLTSSGPINLTAGALAAAGNAGLSHRSTDNKVYLQAGTGGFNILDDQQNTHVAIDSAGVSSFYANVGIGTTGTTTPLTINGGSATAATIQLGNHGDNASVHAKYSLAFKADSTEAIADRSIAFSIGTHSAFYSNLVATIFNEGGANTDFRVESADNEFALFVDAGNNDVISGALNGNRNAALSDKRAGTTGLQLNRPGEDDEGGHIFMTQTAAQNTWMTICSTHDNGATGLCFLIHGVRAADQNRSYAALVRYAYNNTFNIMQVSSQNTIVEYRVSGNSMQYRFTTAGPYIVNLTVMAAG